MQNIPLTMVKSGMVVAKEITASDDPASMTICGKGVKLTDSLINRLEQMGIQSVNVEGHPVKMEGDSSVEEMLAALDHRFRRAGDDPLMMMIKDVYKEQIRRSMGDTGGK
jgi:ubiquinone biosynthesis protein UbiJ